MSDLDALFLRLRAKLLIASPKTSKIKAVFGQFECPIFLYHKGKKEGGAMSVMDRLLACGYPAEMARDICNRYGTNTEGLLLFVRIVELFHDDRREYV